MSAADLDLIEAAPMTDERLASIRWWHGPKSPFGKHRIVWELIEEIDRLRVRQERTEAALAEAQDGLVTYPYCQVFGGNAVVLLTREMIERIREQNSLVSAASLGAEIYGEMGMALLRLDESARAALSAPDPPGKENP